MQNILFEKQGNIGWITLNNSEQRNALTLKMMSELIELFEDISKNKDIKVIAIKANGPDFCVGHNINELVGSDLDLKHFRRIFTTCKIMMSMLHNLPQPVIASVQGNATAAGCQFVAMCDLVIAEKQACFSTPGVKIGLFCSTPMVPLSRLIGRRKALDMLFTGRNVSAEEAERIGLINKSVDKVDLLKETENLANTLAQYSGFTLGFGKQVFYKQIDMDFEKAFDFSVEAISKNCLDVDAQEGMKAFLEKRKAMWKDRK